MTLKNKAEKMPSEAMLAYRERKYFLIFFILFCCFMLGTGLILALALTKDQWTAGTITGTSILCFAGLFGIAITSLLLYKSTQCPVREEPISNVSSVSST